MKNMNALAVTHCIEMFVQEIKKSLDKRTKYLLEAFQLSPPLYKGYNLEILQLISNIVRKRPVFV